MDAFGCSSRASACDWLPALRPIVFHAVDRRVSSPSSLIRRRSSCSMDRPSPALSIFPLCYEDFESFKENLLLF